MGQVLDWREHLDIVQWFNIAEDVVERDPEAGYHKDVGQHRERYQVFQIAHLTKQYQCRNQRGDVQTYVYIPPGAEIRDLMRKNEMHSDDRKDRSRDLWKGSRQHCDIVSQREKILARSQKRQTESFLQSAMEYFSLHLSMKLMYCLSNEIFVSTKFCL